MAPGTHLMFLMALQRNQRARTAQLPITVNQVHHLNSTANGFNELTGGGYSSHV